MIVVSSLLMRTFLAVPSMVERHVLELDAEIFADDLAAGDDGDVFQHGLAAIAEARRLHGGNLEAAAQLVDDQRRQRLAFDVFGDDDERLAALDDCLKQRQHRPAAPESFFSWRRM